MDPLHILIVDDHPLFRKGMRTSLKSIDGTEVVGEATTGEEAIAKAEILQPDVILMDLQMPGINGLTAIREIVKTSPHIRILVVSLFSDDDSVFAAMRAGARGYILKDTEEEEMLRAILAVGGGEAIFSPAIATRMMSYFSSTRTKIPKEIFPELTDREREILELIAHGYPNVDIAKELNIGLKTVRNYVSNIYSKLQVADRTQVVIKARDAGFGNEGGDEYSLR
jgi:DNA-binding NarL/FixJ family response regulator